jgi:hypothetical protein
MEASYIIRLNIKHYKELLKLKSLSEDQRQAALRALAEAEEELPFALEEEAERRREIALSPGFWAKQ